jgi:hypothetical protein
MDQIYALYQKLYRTRIRHHAKDKYENGQLKGHVVEVIFSE